MLTPEQNALIAQAQAAMEQREEAARRRALQERQALEREQWLAQNRRCEAQNRINAEREIRRDNIATGTAALCTAAVITVFAPFLWPIIIGGMLLAGLTESKNA